MHGENQLPVSIAIAQLNKATLGAASGLRRSPKMRRPLRLGTLLLASLGLLGGANAQAAEPFTGVCPVLGSTQPKYDLSNPPQPPALVPVDEVAFLQSPIRVSGTYQGKDYNYPICAVYMSLNDSLQPVKPQVIPATNVPTDLLFPDLRAQPWFLAPGGSLASDISTALINNGYWDPQGGPTNQWADDGIDLLANPNANPNKSPYSAYFLWGEQPEGLKGRYLWYQNNAGKITWQSDNSGMPDGNGFDEPNLDPDKKYWFWVVDAPGGPPARVPGPLPVLGAGAAYGWSRRLRRRIRASSL